MKFCELGGGDNCDLCLKEKCKHWKTASQLATPSKKEVGFFMTKPEIINEVVNCK